AAPPNANVELVGTALGDPMREKLVRQTKAYDARDTQWLAASWARARIRDLEDRYAAGSHEVETTIVAVSKQFSVLSRFTAFLAIDRAEIANAGGRLTQIVQPVEEPAGWEMGGMSGKGATRGGGGGLARGEHVLVARKMRSAPATNAAPPP